MRLVKPADGVIFINDKLENEFNSLEENNWLKLAIRKCMEDLKENAFWGENIPKKLIPKEYTKEFRIENLWWYPLPEGWRLVYTILTPNNMEIVAAIVEYFDHKNYERRFHY